MPVHYLLHHVCLDCRRSFKRPVDLSDPRPSFRRKCPHCGAIAFEVGRHFRPPRRDNLAQWEKVRFLIANGFYFQHVYETARGGALVRYPRTLKAAREFVRKYRAQALTRRSTPTARRSAYSLPR